MRSSNNQPGFLGMGFLLLTMLAAFVVWAAYFELDQTVQAQGQLIPQDRTQLVQAADGGVLQSIFVVEGQRVKAGQRLAVLEKDRANAGVDEVTNRLAGLTITKLRATAEASDAPLNFKNYSQSHPALVAGQQALYKENMQAMQAELDAQQANIAIAVEEYNLTKRLHTAGDVSLVDLMRIERQIVELKQKKVAVRDKYRVDARREIAKIEDEISASVSKLQERKSVLDHTDIVSPMNGVVKFLKITTVGGVLRAGDELMQISPTDGGYIIEAKVSPNDIGQLNTGLPVAVRLDTFDYNVYGKLNAHLKYISSDTLTEQGADGRSNVFYRIHVNVLPQQTNQKLTLDQLKPGMTATLDIQTGKRSVLNFIAKPILRAFTGALSQK